MAVTWGGVGISDDLLYFIYMTTGAWPSTVELGRGSADVISNTYYSRLNLTDGPYILFGLSNDPDYGTGDMDFRITVDGTQVWERTGVPYINNNYVVGLYFDDHNDCPPIMARSTLLVESRRSTGVTGTQRLQYLYMKYSLS